MRKAVLIVAVLVICSIGLVPSVGAEQTGYHWTEHFNYSTLQEMTSAGWTIGIPAQTSFNTSAIILSGIGQDNPIGYTGIQNGISDWRTESRGRWIAGGGGSIGVSLATEHRAYGWYIDGYYDTFILYIASAKVMEIPTTPILLDEWHVMTMVKIGNNLSLYHNSQYISSYIDNGAIGEVRSVNNVAPWQGTAEYDYLSLDAAPTMKWQKTFGGAASDTGYGIVATQDGGFAALGVTKSYGSGQYDAFLVRGDADGNEVWSRTYGTASGEWSYSLSKTSDGGFLIGGTTTTTGFRAWMVKVASDGTEEWNKAYGDTTQVGFCSIQTTDGGYAITGYLAVTGRSMDLFLMKTDAGGNQQWIKTYGGLGDDWGKSLIQTSDGGYAITGWTTSFGAGKRGYLIKTDQVGVEQYNTTIGTSGSTVCYAATQLPDGGFAICGQTDYIGYGLSDMLAVRTDALGTILWERTYGGTGEDYGSMAFALDDGFVFGGSTGSFNSTQNRLFFVRTDLNGNMSHAGVYGVDVSASGYIGARLADGGFLGVGNTNTYNSGMDDLYVLRIGSFGVAPSPSTSSSSFAQEAVPPVAAVAVGTGLAFIGVLVAGRASEAVATASTSLNGGCDQGRGRMRWRLRLDKVVDFVTGYFKSRASSYVWKQVRKVELEDANAVQRRSLFAGFSVLEMVVIFFTSAFLGLAFMITNKIDLGSPTTWMLYIIVAGLAIIMHDLMHRYMAWRHNVITEYKFWFLGTIVMFVTAVLFGVVYSSPSRLAINDSKNMTAKQEAIVYGSGPAMSLIVFAVFLALIPLGGYIATIGTLGASMNLLTATYALMPFQPMDGWKIYRWKRWLGVVIFLAVLVLYFALVIFVI